MIRRVQDGKRYSKYVYAGPADTIRDTNITAVVNTIEALGTVRTYPNLAEGAKSIDGGKGKFPADSGWVETEPRVETLSPTMVGLSDIGTQIPATRIQIAIRETWVLKPQATGDSSTGSIKQPKDPSKRPDDFVHPGGAITPGGR